MQSTNNEFLRKVVKGHDQNKGMENKGLPKARIRGVPKRTDSRGSTTSFCKDLTDSNFFPERSPFPMSFPSSSVQSKKASLVLLQEHASVILDSI